MTGAGRQVSQQEMTDRAIDAEMTGAEKATSPTVAVVVLEPFRVAHDGKVHRPGDIAEIPQQVADYWASHGWVTATRRKRTTRREVDGHIG